MLQNSVLLLISAIYYKNWVDCPEATTSKCPKEKQFCNIHKTQRNREFYKSFKRRLTKCLIIQVLGLCRQETAFGKLANLQCLTTQI